MKAWRNSTRARKKVNQDGEGEGRDAGQLEAEATVDQEVLPLKMKTSNIMWPAIMLPKSRSGEGERPDEEVRETRSTEHDGPQPQRQAGWHQDFR